MSRDPAPETRRDEKRLGRFVWIALTVALLLRIAVMLTVFNSAEPFTGDGPFYIFNAQEPWRLGIQPPDWPYDDTSAYTTSIGPVYPVFLMPFYNLIPDSAPVAQAVSARLAQAALDTLLVLLVYLIARHLFGERVGRVALVVQALDLRYIFTAGTIATETLFLALFVGAVYLYLRATTPARPDAPLGGFRAAGLLLGIATLTRPVPILFPVVLLAHGWLVAHAPGGDRSMRRRTLLGTAWLVGLMALVIAPWLIRTAYVKGEFVPVSDTGAVHFWRATREDGDNLNTEDAHAQAAAEDTGYDLNATAAHTAGDQYVEAGMEHILDAPLAWAGRVAADTLGSFAQPYGTVTATPSGAGVRESLSAWLRGESTFGDVLAVPALGRRLLMYVWHYWGIVGGLAGFVLALRRAWWRVFPLAGWALYVTGIAAVLLVEPRYLFPMMFAFTVMAAYATVRVWDGLAARGGIPG